MPLAQLGEKYQQKNSILILVSQGTLSYVLV